jgi:hypothetical protein
LPGPRFRFTNTTANDIVLNEVAFVVGGDLVERFDRARWQT